MFFLLILPYGKHLCELHMSLVKSNKKLQFGRVATVRELGAVIRNYRTMQQFSLERVAGITNIGMRFISELERGKETAQLGKAMQLINQLGLEVIIQPRGFSQPVSQIFDRIKVDK